MKVFMIGSTGLLGSAAAEELIERGHQVISIALPPLPEGAKFPKQLQIEFGNYLEMDDDKLRSYLKGCDGFVFAAGVDERVEGPYPIYDMYKKYNIDPVERLLKLAKECGVRHAVICGSYFSYFAKTKPEMKLIENHPYIRSRIDQEEVALSFADDDFSVAVLELPYIFGVQKGRKPVWMFLAEQIQSNDFATFYPAGGSTMVTVRQVAQAICGALVHTKGGKCWPIGWDNLSWNELLEIAHQALGYKDKRIINVPKWMFNLGVRSILKQQKEKGIDGGLNLKKLGDIQYSYFYIDKALGSEPLGVEEDDIKAAITASFELCKEIIDGKSEAIGMKGE